MTRLQLRVPAKPEYARLVRDRFLDFGARCCIAREDMEELVTAVGEAFANAIEHARSCQPVEIELRFEAPDQLIASVTDHGCGFVAATHGSELPPAAAERGRGIPLMRRCCDLLALSSRPGEGTRVLLGRCLRAPPRGSRAERVRQAAGL